MTEDQISQVAVFRFGVIGDFVSGAEMTRPERRRLLRDKCARKWQIPFSEKTRISQSTIKRWIQLYQDSNGDLIYIRKIDLIREKVGPWMRIHVCR